MTVVLEGFEASTFAYRGERYAVYRRGSGPGVVVVHEVPGVTPAVKRFAERVADAGFTVLMPSLFGTPDKPPSAGYIAQSLLHCCIRREFAVLASHRSSPITRWVRALCRQLHDELGGPGVGVIGMCMTGNFGLALMADKSVMAPVLCQPSLPFALGKARRAGVHASDEELAAARKRAKNDGVRLLGLRFTYDVMCPKRRFDSISRELGDAFERIDIDSSPNNPHGIGRRAHSVVTEELVDRDGHPTKAALERVLSFLHEQLDAPVSKTAAPDATASDGKAAGRAV